jgi:hypothetical protein
MVAAFGPVLWLIFISPVVTVTIAMKDGSPSPVKSWVHFGCKTAPFCGVLRRFNKKGLWTLNPQPFDFLGAGGGNRTRMGLRPEDFE